MNSKLKKTIIHETGHFIARYLNKKIFNSGFGTEKMVIKKNNSSNKLHYCGVTVPNRPTNYSPFDEIKDFAEYFAVVVYGCIFESIFLNKNFEECFNCKNSGNGDILQFDFNVNKYFNPITKTQLIHYIKDNYFIELKNNQSHFEVLFNLKFEELLRYQEGEYIVDLKKLEILILPFLNEHTPYYYSFIINLKKNLAKV